MNALDRLRRLPLTGGDWGYRALRPLLFRRSAGDAHAAIITLLQRADANPALTLLADIVHKLTFRQQALTVGGVRLAHPFILAAGFVKGTGFSDESTALAAVERGENIIAGWRSMPLLVGAVEFGSYTREPRTGNSGTVMWRDVATHSTQNRVGLKNPGAVAAAAFLAKHIIDLPPIFGVNIAISPAVDDERAVIDVHESISAFLAQGVVPNWFTLNVSCPNTEDDPTGNQTTSLTRALCEAAQRAIREYGYAVPLWVKLGPDLAESQYRALMALFTEISVQAVIATNTLGQPTPDDPTVQAGIGGGRLRDQAVTAASILQAESIACGGTVDVIGCGGVLSGADYLAYRVRGIKAVQYWSALVYRGPLAAAIIEQELS